MGADHGDAGGADDYAGDRGQVERRSGADEDGGRPVAFGAGGADCETGLVEAVFGDHAGAVAEVKVGRQVDGVGGQAAVEADKFKRVR